MRLRASLGLVAASSFTMEFRPLTRTTPISCCPSNALGHASICAVRRSIHAVTLAALAQQAELEVANKAVTHAEQTEGLAQVALESAIAERETLRGRVLVAEQLARDTASARASTHPTPTLSCCEKVLSVFRPVWLARRTICVAA
jgi:hypothetical protein